MPSLPAFTRARAQGILTALSAAALLALPLLVLRPVSDPSPWLHLKVGEQLLARKSFGLPDPWAPLASHAYVPTQWLPAVTTAELYPHLGAPLIAWERAAGITLLALAVLVWATTLARLWVALAATALAVVAAWPSLTERPQLAGFILLVPVLAAWWRTGHDHRARWHLIPLTWLAAATHGIWSTGLALGGLVAAMLIVSRQVPRGTALRLIGLLAACLAAAACTPVGPRLVLTPFAVSGQGRQFVQEWMPSSVRSPHVMAVLAMLAVAWLCWLAARRRPVAWQLVLLLAAFALALVMQRTVAVAAVVAVPLLCTAAEQALARPHEAASYHSPWRAWAASTLVGLAIAVPVASARATTPAGVPAGLLPQLRALPPDTRIFGDSDITGWVMFNAPDLQPVYDLRVESYSAPQVRRYIAVMAAEPGWDRFLADHRVTAALVPADAPLGAALTEQSRWREVGRSAGLVLLEAPR